MIPNPMSTPAPEAEPRMQRQPQAGRPAPAATAKPRRAPWIVAAVATVAALVAGGLAVSSGAASAAAAEEATDRIASLETRNDNLQSSLERSESERDEAVTALTEAQEAFEAWEAELTARESAVTQEEATAATREFGNGLHVIGTTVEPGVYSTPGQGSCYYAWMSGTGSDADIIDNNIVSGPVTVTLRSGDVFESSRCGTWTKTG
ncbi:hypothetical protein [Agrococcus beijingensis]|uniref:hypothetical protein n=1 Tax=Agrococcus beijingensis TaxID=3068634 RepID=UPI00274113C4|nr:hypothetical protein [Agrococcus sp. REN33]